jgi:L-aspartate oxidase
MNILEADFVIIGSGLAGSTAAYLLSEFGDVLLVSKEPPAKSNSSAAQGGIAAAIGHEDNPVLHEADTLHAGCGLCDPKVVAYLTEKAPKLVRWLAEIGVPFDKNNIGEFELGLEGAHSQRRILHAGGDATGRKVMETITDALEHIPNINRLSNIHVVALLQNNEKSVIGALGQYADEPNHDVQFVARQGTILATGGAGQLFTRTTNPSGATGDGIALAYKAGALIRNVEFVQFHPTALDHVGVKCFLISEAVRGAGGVLVNRGGEPIMDAYPLRDLEQRDVVAREIYTRMQQNEKVFLDCKKIKNFRHEFPTIYDKCISNGLNPATGWIPVSPAAHFMMGGVAAAIDGRTSIRGLYALGEVSSTGVHGANRLASNSLLECLVMAFSLAEHMRSVKLLKLDTEYQVSELDLSKILVPDSPDLLRKVQLVMWKAAGIIRDEESMKDGLKVLNQLQQVYPQSSAVCTARLILKAALSRQESRGAHFRSDFPHLDPKRNGADTIQSIKTKNSLFVSI